MRKSNFNEFGKDPAQATVRADAAHHHTRLFMDAEIKGYSQWFAGKLNNVADALSRDWHQDDEELTSILRIHFPQQMPTHFKISPLPNEINSWLISLLQLSCERAVTGGTHDDESRAWARWEEYCLLILIGCRDIFMSASESKRESSCLKLLPWLPNEINF